MARRKINRHVTREPSNSQEDRDKSASVDSGLGGSVCDEQEDQIRATTKIAEEPEIVPECAAESDDYYKSAIGEVFNCQYQAIYELGAGSYGKVLLCWKLHPDENPQSRFIALKIGRANLSLDEEVQILKKTTSLQCENLLMYIDDLTHYHDNNLYQCIATEACLQDLLSRMNTEERFSIQKAKNLAHQLLSGLNALHKNDLVHLDIKPDNLMLSKRDRTSHEYELCDVSISILESIVGRNKTNQKLLPLLNSLKRYREELSSNYDPTSSEEVLKIGDLSNAFHKNARNATAPTQGYKSPQNLLGDKTARTSVDIYSAGCTIFEMVTGVTIFNTDADTPSHETDKENLRIMSQYFGNFGHQSPNTTKSPYMNDPDIMNAERKCLARRLHKEHGLPENEACQCAEFLKLMMANNSRSRRGAAKLLEHEWLKADVPKRKRKLTSDPGACSMPAGKRPMND